MAISKFHRLLKLENSSFTTRKSPGNSSVINMPGPFPGRHIFWLKKLIFSHANSSYIIAAIGYAAMLLFLCWDVLFSINPRVLGAPGTDVEVLTLVWRGFGFDQLRHGHLPLWNPHIFSGAPYFGAFEAGLLYPFNWLHLLLPLGLAYNWTMVSHLLMAGIFMFAWCRFKGGSGVGAFLSGVCFMFSGAFYLHIYSGGASVICSATWIPFLMLCLDGWNRQNKFRWGLCGSFAVAMQILAGHPQIVYYTGLTATIYACLKSITTRSPRGILGVGAIWAGGTLLAAVQILAGIAASRGCVRAGGASYTFASMFALPLENLLTWLSPFVFGDSSNFPYYGSCYLWEASLFLSSTGFLLAMVGIWKNNLKERVVILTLLSIVLILALGSYFPFLYRLLYDHLPGYNHFRGVSKFIIPMIAFFSVYAGLGWDKAMDSGHAARALAAVALWISLFCFILAGIISSSAHRGEVYGKWGRFLAYVARSQDTMDRTLPFQDPKFIFWSSQFASGQLRRSGWNLLGAGVLLAGICLRRRIGYGLVLLSVLELLFFAKSMRATCESPPQLPASWRQLLSDVGGEHRVLQNYWKYTNLGMAEGFHNIWGYNPFVLKRYAEFLFFTQGRDPGRAVPYLKFDRVPKILRLLRLRYVFPEDTHLNPQILHRPLPRLFLVRKWRVVTGRDDILRELTNPAFDAEREVLLEEPPNPVPSLQGQGRISVLAQSSDALEVEAALSAPAILLITDPYDPGWQIVSLIPKAPQRYNLQPADYILQAVSLPAGLHRIRFEYSPIEYRIGRIISILSWLVFLAALIQCNRVHRRE